MEACKRLVSLFFEAEYAQNASESVIVKPILLAVFYLCNQEETVLQQTADEEDEPVSETVQFRSIYVGHKISDLEVRRIVIEFGRCFATVYISDFAFRRCSSSTATSELANACETFLHFNHNQGEPFAPLALKFFCEPPRT